MNTPLKFAGKADSFRREAGSALAAKNCGGRVRIFGGKNG
jgi:seryl-tRNA synthetase